MIVFLGNTISNMLEHKYFYILCIYTCSYLFNIHLILVHLYNIISYYPTTDERYFNYGIYNLLKDIE